MATQMVDTHGRPCKPGFSPFFYLLAIGCILSALLVACSSPASGPAVQPQVVGDAQAGGHTPVILRVVERQEVSDGYLWFHQDIYFTDVDGDAAVMTHRMISTSLAYSPNFTDDPIEASADEQQVEALFTLSIPCWQKLELAFENRIQDRAGNLSEPVLFSMSCTAPQPLDTTPLLISGLGMALAIAFILLLGFWLLFRKRLADSIPALRSMIFIFFLFMLLKFFQVVLHEGGHALLLLWRGVPITLYVHPFIFNGYARPIIAGETGLWKDILGSATAIPVGLIISLQFWKRRSPTLLLWVMLFPYIALMDGYNIMGIQGDFWNLAQSTGLPAALFLILGVLIFCIGLISLFSLFPLAGLDPCDLKTLFVLPAAMFMISVLSFLVAHLFVPGSPINLEYFLGQEILLSANYSSVIFLIFGLFLAVLYVTLFRKLYPRLPAWLRSKPVDLTWEDLRLPGILWAVSVVIGLIIVI